MKLTKCWVDNDGCEVLFFEPIDKGNYVVTFLLGENELEQLESDVRQIIRECANGETYDALTTAQRLLIKILPDINKEQK